MCGHLSNIENLHLKMFLSHGIWMMHLKKGLL